MLEMLPGFSREEFAAGATVFNAGDVGDAAYLVESGSVEVLLEADGVLVRGDLLAEGALFGEIALLDRLPRSGTVRTLTPTVLVRIDRHEGVKQSELAEMLDLQPISLTRVLDRLAENGLIERRPDPNDRRANLLYLMPAARPLLDQLSVLATDMMKTVLEGLDARTIERTLRDLGLVKDNLRTAIGRNAGQPPSNEPDLQKDLAS